MRISRGESAAARRIPRPRAGLRGGRRGNGIVEASLVVPALFFVTMAMIEFGQYFLAKNTLQAAARDGARTAIITSATHTQAQQAVSTTASAAGYSSGTYTVTFTDPTTTPSTTITNIASVTKGSPIKVTVTATMGTLAGRPMLYLSDKQIVASTTMVKE